MDDDSPRRAIWRVGGGGGGGSAWRGRIWDCEGGEAAGGADSASTLAGDGGTRLPHWRADARAYWPAESGGAAGSEAAGIGHGASASNSPRGARGEASAAVGRGTRVVESRGICDVQQLAHALRGAGVGGGETSAPSQPLEHAHAARDCACVDAARGATAFTAFQPDVLPTPALTCAHASDAVSRVDTRGPFGASAAMRPTAMNVSAPAPAQPQPPAGPAAQWRVGGSAIHGIWTQLAAPAAPPHAFAGGGVAAAAAGVGLPAIWPAQSVAMLSGAGQNLLLAAAAVGLQNSQLSAAGVHALYAEAWRALQDARRTSAAPPQHPASLQQAQIAAAPPAAPGYVARGTLPAPPPPPPPAAAAAAAEAKTAGPRSQPGPPRSFLHADAVSSALTLGGDAAIGVVAAALRGRRAVKFNSTCTIVSRYHMYRPDGALLIWAVASVLHQHMREDAVSRDAWAEEDEEDDEEDDEELEAVMRAFDEDVLLVEKERELRALVAGGKDAAAAAAGGGGSGQRTRRLVLASDSDEEEGEGVGQAGAASSGSRSGPPLIGSGACITPERPRKQPKRRVDARLAPSQPPRPPPPHHHPHPPPPPPPPLAQSRAGADMLDERPESRGSSAFSLRARDVSERPSPILEQPALEAAGDSSDFVAAPAAPRQRVRARVRRSPQSAVHAAAPHLSAPLGAAAASEPSPPPKGSLASPITDVSSSCLRGQSSVGSSHSAAGMGDEEAASSAGSSARDLVRAHGGGAMDMRADALGPFGARRAPSLAKSTGGGSEVAGDFMNEQDDVSDKDDGDENGVKIEDDVEDNLDDDEDNEQDNEELEDEEDENAAGDAKFDCSPIAEDEQITDEKACPAEDDAIVVASRGKRRRREIPNFNYMQRFLAALFQCGGFSHECGIICLIFLSRLLAVTGMPLHAKNWRPILIISLLLSQKLWDDRSLGNSQFSRMCPLFTPRQITRLERRFLRLIHYDVRITSQQYAKYYFELLRFSRSDASSAAAPQLGVKPAGSAEVKLMETRSISALARLRRRMMLPKSSF